MAEPLIRTKLMAPPPRREAISRTRLLDALDQGLSRRLVLVSAAAGSGKTTLLAEWISRLELPAAWLSLDEGDNDPARFAVYLAAALKRLAPDMAEPPSLSFQAPQSAAFEPILAHWVNRLAELPSDVVLVLDDYHLIQARPVHQALRLLLEHLPPQVHLYIATRADPPLPLARLRARNQLVEIRVADLRFRPDEAAAFLRQVMGLELSAAETAELAARTEGWVVGLQLAGLSLQRTSDRAGFVAAFAGNQAYIADYLLEEVLRSQPEALTTFLIKTSILPRLCGSLCDAITGRADGQGTLEQLQAANLFISALDTQRQWYAYHRLFADLLRQRLKQDLPELGPELHRRAAQWHVAQGATAEAIPHLLSAGDLEAAAECIEQMADATLLRGEAATLLHWLEQLPEEMVRRRLPLNLAYIWAQLLSSYSLGAVEGRLSHLQHSAPQWVLPLQGFVALLQGRIADAYALAQRARQHLSEDDRFLWSVTHWVLTLSRMADLDLYASGQAIGELLRGGQMADHLWLSVMSLCNLGELYIRQGRLHDAQSLYERVLDLAVDERGARLPIAGMALVMLAELAREWNDLDRAERLLTEGLQCLRGWGDTVSIDGYCSLALLRLAQGDGEGIVDAFSQAQGLAQKSDVTQLDDQFVALLQVRVWSMLGQSETARYWLREAGGDPDAEGGVLSPDLSYFDYHLVHHRLVALARIHIVERSYDKALRLLDGLLAGIERFGWRPSRREMEVQILRALALRALGQVEPALMALTSALAQAEPSGYVRTFLDEGPRMAQLLEEARQRGFHLDYVERLLAAFPPGLPEQPLIEPLSERELQVLQLIAEGFTNQEIAQRLIVAVGTVKAHSSNIYGKLGVGNRVQAVARAQELGLL
ncbi:MAG: tetratricopeptide repeat protein [Anaerolineae bacterium]|nr:tetratricopeptide repeat protein [Anaerolineae bacterium]